MSTKRGYQQAIVVTRPSTVADGMGGFTEGVSTHVYSNWADVQETGQRFIKQRSGVSDEGDAVAFLFEPDRVADEGIVPGDVVQVLWDRTDVVVDANGDPVTDPDGEWTYSGGRQAIVHEVRQLDDSLVLRYA